MRGSPKTCPFVFLKLFGWNIKPNLFNKVIEGVIAGRLNPVIEGFFEGAPRPNVFLTKPYPQLTEDIIVSLILKLSGNMVGKGRDPGGHERLIRMREGKTRPFEPACHRQDIIRKIRCRGHEEIHDDRQFQIGTCESL